MRVLHVTIGMNFEEGGTQAVVCGLTKALAKQGVGVSIFATDWPDADIGRACVPEGTKVEIFKRDALAKIWNSHSSDFDRAINEQIGDFDLVHIHGIWHYPCFSAYRAAKKSGKPFIITPHGALEPRSLGFKFLRKAAYFLLVQKKMLKEAAVLWAVNNEEAEHMRKKLKTSRISVIFNGIDLDEFKNIPGRKILDRYYPALENKKIVTFLGRLHKIKGIDILIKSFALAAKQKDDLMLVVAGPDNDGYKKELEDIARSEKIIDKIVFTGLATGRKKLAILGNSAILVLPSRSEVKGLVLAEAMACGVPVVATHRCNFKEVGEVKAGFLTDLDPVSMASSILELANDPKLRRQMGENGKNYVVKNLSWEKIGGVAIALYETAVNGRIQKKEI